MQLRTRRPLDYFDELRASQHIASIGETSPDNTSSLLNANNGTMRLGHLLSLMVISEPIPDALSNKRRIRNGTLDVEIAAFLGIHHFNERSGAVITDLPDRLKDCNIYFTMDLRDSQEMPLQSSRQVLSSVNNDAKNATNKNITYPFPTGIVGTGRSSTAAPTSVLSGIFSVPQVTCCATSRAITSNSNSPMFARTVPTNQQDAVAAAEYLSRSLGLTHVGVVFVQGAYGEQFAADFRNAANARSMTVVSASYDESTPDFECYTAHFMDNHQPLKMDTIAASVSF